MRGWRFIMIVVAVAAVVLAAAAIRHSGEPRFQGRTLTEWIDEEQTIQYDANGDSADCQKDPKWQAATNAVYQIGTNALPWLVKWGNAKDSKTKAAVIRWLDAHPGLHWHIRSATDRRIEATIGLILLGDKAPEELRPQL